MVKIVSTDSIPDNSVFILLSLFSPDSSRLTALLAPGSYSSAAFWLQKSSLIQMVSHRGYLSFSVTAFKVFVFYFGILQFLLLNLGRYFFFFSNLSFLVYTVFPS